MSVTTYRDAGFLPEAFVNFLCLLGWSPKNDREQMSRQELVDAFSLEGINRANAVINFTEEDPFDPKAVWLNAEHIRALPVEELSRRLLPVVRAAGFEVSPARMLQITPLVRERIRLLRDVLAVADFFLVDRLAAIRQRRADSAERRCGNGPADSAAFARDCWPHAPTDSPMQTLELRLRDAAQEMGIKAGQMFQPIRVAVCGRKQAPPLFETLEVLGREKSLERIEQAIDKIDAGPQG